MQNGLAALAKSLEAVIEKSPLSKVGGVDRYGSELVAYTYLFAKRESAERAKELETAFASGDITLDEFNEKFPNVPYILVNAAYQSFIAVSAITSAAHDGGKLLISGLEEKLSRFSMELCKGVAGSYNPDDDKFTGELLVGIYFSADGAAHHVVSKVSHTLLGLPVEPGASAAEVFSTLESYVISNNA